MKPDIDLDDPRVKKAISTYEVGMHAAHSVSQTVESAVLPIYLPLKSPSKPEQIGSCVAVRIKGENFIFSASHVFDEIGSRQIMVGLGIGMPIMTLQGERFSTVKGVSGSHLDDPIDASVFHIQQDLPDEFLKLAISLDQIDEGTNLDRSSPFIASGFKANRSKTRGNRADAKREGFPTIEVSSETYDQLRLDQKMHLALAFEKKTLVQGRWQQTPSAKGMSGGAIMRIEGISLRKPISDISAAKQLLSAILIEQRQEKNNLPGVIVGTRVGVHLGLIHKYLPRLLELEQ